MYFIYFIDLLSPTTNVVLKTSYNIKSIAVSNLESSAIEYIKELEGSKQSMIALQNNKTLEQILTDDTLKEGLYAKQEGETIVIYQKQKTVSAGKIWNSYELKIMKMGVFGTTCYKQNVQIESNIEPITKQQKTINNNKHGNLMEELHKLFANSENFGLKTIYKQHYE